MQKNRKSDAKEHVEQLAQTEVEWTLVLNNR
jgi:hypothetical protein